MYALLSARSSTGYDAKSERPSVERAKSIFHITSKGDEGIVRRVPRHERVGAFKRRFKRLDEKESLAWQAVLTTLDEIN